ncbi:MAG: helix-hairpin-helix domain-containing protein [Mariprofundaceae bacterium]|nr:helix-hairpin-helix domain-containing protein [Mariprofundaceae bacterium]
MRIVIGVLFALFFFLSPPAFSSTINLNTATSKDLQSIKGIGEKTAQAIIEYRTTNGNFKSVDALVKVSGIGNKKLAKVKDQLSVGSAKAVASKGAKGSESSTH